MKVFIYTVFIILTFTTAGCNCSEDCSNMDWKSEFHLVGFDDSNGNTAIIKRYVKGSQFSVFRDSTVYSNLTQMQFGYYNKNGLMFEAIIDDSSDYKVLLPNNESVNIYDMQIESIKCKSCSKRYFINQLQDASILTSFEVTTDEIIFGTVTLILNK